MKVFVVTKMFLGRGSLADCRVLVESWVRKGYGTLAFSNLAIVNIAKGTTDPRVEFCLPK